MNNTIISVYYSGYFLTCTTTMERTVYGMQIKELFMEHKNNGKTLPWISDAMHISVNTLKEWWSKLKRGESLWDKRKENWRAKTFSDTDLVEYIEQNVHATLKDIWNHFSVSDVAILKRLRNIHYSYKKKRWDIKKEMMNTETSLRSS